MKLLSLVLGTAIILGAGFSANVLAHGERGYGGDYRSHGHHEQYRNARRHGNHRRYWRQQHRHARPQRYWAPSRHRHNDSWYGLYLFLGGR